MLLRFISFIPFHFVPFRSIHFGASDSIVVFLLLVCLFFFILVLKKEKFFFILTKKTDFTEFFIIFIFYRVSVIFVRPTKVGQGNYRVFTEFYRVLPLFTGFYLFLPGFT